MLGIGFLEIVVIAVVCLIAFGPKQLPTLMHKLAYYYRQLANLKDELNAQILNIDPSTTAKPKENISDSVVRDKNYG